MNERDKINQDDCPSDPASHYPGKKSRNNPRGSSLTKDSFIDEEIVKWVRHFNNSDRYNTTPFGHRVMYLRKHLRYLNVPLTDIKEKLMKIERNIAQENVEENIVQSQNLLNNEMDIDVAASASQEKDNSHISRWDIEEQINQILMMTDEQIFESDLIIKDYVKTSVKYKRREVSYILSKSDEEIFSMYDNIAPHIKRTKEFIARYKNYAESYMEDHFAQASSQEILLRIPETPIVVQHSDAYKKRLCHLSFQEKSERLVMKNIKETLTELKKTPEGRKQAILFTAGVSHEVFGDPGLDLTTRTRAKARKIKENLLKGKSTTLKEESTAKRSEFPKSVIDIAQNHWKENTIIDPTIHSGRALEEDGETIPTRFQDRTDREMYTNFQEECQDRVKVEMTKLSKIQLELLRGRKDSDDKRRRQAYAHNMCER